MNLVSHSGIRGSWSLAEPGQALLEQSKPSRDVMGAAAIMDWTAFRARSVVTSDAPGLFIRE